MAGSFNSYCLEQCRPECTKGNFETSISSLSYPTRSRATELMRLPHVASKFPNNETITYDALKSSVLSFKVLFDRLQYTRISEIDETSIVTVIANVGGIFGLCLGVSFLSFVEILELTAVAVHMIVENFKKLFRSKRNNVRPFKS